MPLMAGAQPADDALLNVRMDRHAIYVAEVISVENTGKLPLHGIDRSVQIATVRISHGSEKG